MQIALINRSNRYVGKSILLSQMASAVNLQMSRHVGPAWDMINWGIGYYAVESSVPAGYCKLYIFDNSDQAGALGYHDQDMGGKPYGKVFVNPIIGSGGSDVLGANSVSVVISHEACEMMGDPEVNCWRQMGNGDLTCQELCDAVEGDYYNIVVNGRNISVSNFLLPAWFDYAPVSGSRFDYMRRLSGPFTMSSGGYMIMMSGGEISYVFGSKEAEERYKKNENKKQASSRGVRRVGFLKYGQK